MSRDSNFFSRPFAHRGVHGSGVAENAPAAFEVACAAGYGIELDVQPSADGVPMVFHDATLDRLTEATGRIDARDAAELCSLHLAGGPDRIPTLSDTLARIGDRAAVLVEIKEQPAPGFEQAVGQVVAEAARGGARVAVMSFDPAMIHALDWLPAGVALGLTTCAEAGQPAHLDARDRAARAWIDGWRPGMSFVSHDHRDLSNPRLAELKAEGARILCWTIRSAAEARAARTVADQITFEGFRPG